MRIWSRLGVTAGVLGGAYIVIAEIIKQSDSWRLTFWIAGWCLLLFGMFLVTLCLGVHRSALREILQVMFPTDQAEVQSEDEDDIPTRALNRLHGAILIMATGAMMVIVFPPIQAVEAVEIARPIPDTNSVREDLVVTQELEAPIQVEPVAVEFPEIRIQGITVRSSGNSILVDRRTYFEGDHIEAAKVLVITPTNVLIQVQGQTRLIGMPDF